MVKFSFNILINKLLLSSILMLLIFILRKNKFRVYSERFNYYIWLPINIFLVLPIQIKLHINERHSEIIENVVSNYRKYNLSFNVKNIKQNTNNNLLSYIISIYLLVTITLGIILIIRYFYDKRNIIKNSFELKDENINLVFKKSLKSLNIKKYKPLKVSNYITTPINVGVFKPYVILPNYNYSEEELELIFKHELIHFLRKDFYYKFLVMINTCIYWFNPLMYLMSKVVSYECEVSCDEEVIKSLNSKEEIKTYGLIILKTDAKDYIKNNCLLSTLNKPCITKNRITALFNNKLRKEGKPSICLSLMLMIFLSIILSININIDSKSNEIIKSAMKSVKSINEIAYEDNNIKNAENIREFSEILKGIMESGDISNMESYLSENNINYNMSENTINGESGKFQFSISYNNESLIVREK